MTTYKLNISDEPHCHDLESLGSVFIPIIKNAVSSEDLIGSDIIMHWRTIVGDTIRKFCRPVKTKFSPRTDIRTLYVETPVGGFALEIQHQEQYILDKINAYFGYAAIHKIKVSQNIDMLPPMPEKPQKKEAALSANQEEMLFQAIDEIKDENLREILLKIGKNVILSNKE